MRHAERADGASVSDGSWRSAEKPSETRDARDLASTLELIVEALHLALAPSRGYSPIL